MAAEELKALGQGNGMRDGARDPADLRPRTADQVVNDANVRLGEDGRLEVQEVIVVFMDRPVQRVLDRYDRVFDGPGRQRLEHIEEPLSRCEFQIPAGEDPAGRLLAEGPARALESYSCPTRRHLFRLPARINPAGRRSVLKIG